jgi:hypothetical protein
MEPDRVLHFQQSQEEDPHGEPEQDRKAAYDSMRKVGRETFGIGAFGEITANGHVV